MLIDSMNIESSPLTEVDQLESAPPSPPALILDEDFCVAPNDNFTLDTIKREDSTSVVVGNVADEEEEKPDINHINLIELEDAKPDISMEDVKPDIGVEDGEGEEEEDEEDEEDEMAGYDVLRELVSGMRMPRGWIGGEAEWRRVLELMVRNMNNNVDHGDEYGAWLQVMSGYTAELRNSIENFQRALAIQADRHAGRFRRFF